MLSRIPIAIIIIIAVILVIILLAFLGIIPGLKPSRPPPVTLELWGIEDEEKVFEGIIRSFHQENLHISINYSRFDADTFENTLVNRMAEGRGPDIFMLRNSSIFKHRDKIFSLPQRSLKFTPRDFSKIFTDKTAEDLIDKKGEIIGLPLFTDTLALFYNKDIFNTAGIAEPPRNWEEVVELSRKLTKIDPSGGDIIRSGIALGSFDNVEHALEIISALILQRGDSIINSKTGGVELREGTKDAFSFYTSFADQTKQNFSWSSRLANSFDALAEEKSTMAFGFSGDIKKILAKNPHLNLGVISFPQLKNARLPLSYAAYFFPTVSKFSKHRLESWQFILFAVSGDSAKEYLEKSNRPPARRDLLSQVPQNPLLEVFYKQSLIAQSWPIPDYEAVNRLFGEAVQTILTQRDISKPVEKMESQLKLLLP